MSLPEQIDFTIINEFSERGDQKIIAKRLKLNKQTVSDALRKKSRNWAVVEEQLKISLDRATKIKRHYEELVRYKKEIIAAQKELQSINA